MNNILEELKQYFRDTPREKIMSDWAETKREAPKGPKICEFLETSRMVFKWKNKNNLLFKTNNDILANPKYTSGFFISKLFL